MNELKKNIEIKIHHFNVNAHIITDLLIEFNILKNPHNPILQNFDYITRMCLQINGHYLFFKGLQNQNAFFWIKKFILLNLLFLGLFSDLYNYTIILKLKKK